MLVRSGAGCDLPHGRRKRRSTTSDHASWNTPLIYTDRGRYGGGVRSRGSVDIRNPQETAIETKRQNVTRCRVPVLSSSALT